MIDIKTQFPYIDEYGVEKKHLIKTYAEDENGDQYYIKQLETGVEYLAAVDVYPCRYTYEATDRKFEVEDKGVADEIKI